MRVRSETWFPIFRDARAIFVTILSIGGTYIYENRILTYESVVIKMLYKNSKFRVVCLSVAVLPATVDGDGLLARLNFQVHIHAE